MFGKQAQKVKQSTAVNLAPSGCLIRKVRSSDLLNEAISIIY